MERSELQARAKELATALEKLDKEFNGKEMPSENEDQFNAIVNELEDLTVKLEKIKEREGKAAAVKAKLQKPTNRLPVANTTDVSKLERSESHEKAFDDYIRAGHASAPEAKAALSDFSDSEGGTLSPVGFINKLLEQLYNRVKIRQVASTLATSNKSIEIPLLNRDSGFNWLAEAVTISAEDLTGAVGVKRFELHKCGALWRVSNELLQDAAINVQDLMIKHFVGRLARFEENAFINGTGSDQPMGLLNNSSVGTRAMATTDTIVYNDLVNMVTDLKEQYRENAVWLINKAYLAQIMKLKDTTNQPIWVPNKDMGITDGPLKGASKLLGYPVIESEYMPASTTNSGDKFLLFGDLGFYQIVDSVGVNIKRSDEESFATDQVTFRMTKRLDADVLDGKAINIGKRA